MWTFSGKQISVAREVHGISQQELADKIGSSQGLVSRWELGKAMPNVTSLLQVCNALSVPPKFFFLADSGYDDHQNRSAA